MRIVTIIGARPQFIKSSVVSFELRKAGIDELVIHTGQHYDKSMSAIFFSQLGLPQPAYNLEVGSGSHAVQTSKMLVGIEEVLLKEKPDLVLIYGDTNSTLAGALAASKIHIPVAHVEAGLRSHNMRMPEEINRLVADRLSSMLFTPTFIGKKNLLLEGFVKEKIFLTGDVMYDAAIHFSKSIHPDDLSIDPNILNNPFVLATIHRAENTDNPENLKGIIKALKKISEQIRVILPLHPRTKRALQELDLNSSLSPSITVLEPLSYFDMIYLESRAQVIVTDSGGVQKEAYFFRKPCITVRTETEWQELIDTKWNSLVNPADSDGIIDAFNKIMTPVDWPQLYGSGDASKKIVLSIDTYLRK
ncbi:UDP-N-acetylglucosamine 2-epimerase (non-hydrolyzing) [Deinococcus detaillensis]|uniref:UDP-N-acetylglucosamine 2-epimerase (Non-hydrolyzing) n=1 Tax=Deinococcus detaillensis TaxID=2592048 RepID=A0A553UMN6_9DEIO|nr:UDP-N-acetylglucosamine 2-epimerase (non-hydrolyzing) [Deinococcus detaillensis]TSA81467.1 UDP-N-acetylglucosamine 2-epimerase (non-hydrolyzing) [Deinococcus detaillensis]